MKESFDIIYKNLYPTMVKYVFSKCQNKEQSQDIASEVMIKVYRNYDKFDGQRATIRTYVYRAAYNKLIDHWKKVKHEHISISEFLHGSGDNGEKGYTLDIVDTCLNPLDELINNQLAEEIDKAIRELPMTYSEVCDKYFVHGYKMIEIADELHIKENTVKTRIFKSRTKLKEKLIHL